MTPDRLVTVCALCLTAACWRGHAACAHAGVALTTQKRVRELRPLRREDPDNWTTTPEGEA
jgi:hypothetical protein